MPAKIRAMTRCQPSFWCKYKKAPPREMKARKYGVTGGNLYVMRSALSRYYASSSGAVLHFQDRLMTPHSLLYKHNVPSVTARAANNSPVWRFADNSNAIKQLIISWHKKKKTPRKRCSCPPMMCKLEWHKHEPKRKKKVNNHALIMQALPMKA